MLEQEKEARIQELRAELNSLKAKPRKEKLKLQKSELANLRVGQLKNGKKYSVRENRDRFFFPDEWMRFYDSLRGSQKLTFDLLINTGARINEARNIKVGDCDLERGNITLRVTKVKSKKGEKNPRPRIISISSQFSKKLNKYIRANGLQNTDYLDLLSRPAAHIALKTNLKKIGIADWYMFSLHNIRKTHGNFLKALGVDSGEICLRLGHDFETFRKHYGSPDIFNFKDLQNMRLILGDIYERR